MRIKYLMNMMDISNMNVFFIFFILFSIQICCMQEISIQKKRDKKLYFQECKEDNKYAEEELYQDILLAYITNPLSMINQLELQLQAIRKEIIEERDNVFCCMRQNHQIPKDIWQSRVEIAHNMNEYEESRQSRALAFFQHDKNIPGDLSSILKKNLIDSGINPERFDITISQKSTLRVEPPCFGVYVKGTRLGSEVTNPGLIELNKVSSLSVKEGLCCIVKNLLQKDARFYVYLIRCLTGLNRYFIETSYINIPKKDIKQVTNQMTILSSLLAATDNKCNAAIIKKYYNKTYTSFLSIEDYDILCIINRLHQGIAWIKKYMINTIEKPLISITMVDDKKDGINTI